jgi:hypothetical protein
MARYDVYATRYDSPNFVEELLPARGLSFSMPLSDDGEASFSATVEPGRSAWRAAVGLPFSGILIARDGQPVWQGRITGERQSGPRSFQFVAREWGSWFADCPAPQADYLYTNSHDAFRDLVAKAQAVPGQDVKVTAADSTGGAPAGVQVQAWDTQSVADVFRAIAEADGGPEWYFGTAGSLSSPVRTLVLGDRLGSTSAVDVLHYVESTVDWRPSASAPGVSLLSDLFPSGDARVEDLPRRGGNVLAVSRDRDLARSATQVIATGDGSEVAQLRRTARASRVLAQGWPLITKFAQHGSVSDGDMLQRLAQADLAAASGIATRYSLSTFDGAPDWTMVPRGSTMRVVLDTDVYAVERPYSFESRLLDVSVDVDDNGPAQVSWSLAEVMEAR